MTVPFLELARETQELRDELDAAIDRVLRASAFVLGEEVERFERDFAAYCGAEHAVGVASGTDAIAIALRAVGVRAGDEVITAANTCTPTIAGIEHAGAVPVLADVDAGTYTLDPAALERVATPRTRAIVPVHLYGQCAEMERILGFARAHGLKVVEDAAQAHGAEYGGARAGSLADAAAFSFYPTKNLGALGDGGAVLTSDGDVAERARRLRNYGERERHVSDERGTNSRLDGLQAALLGVKLAHLERWNERRRRLARRYDELLDDTAFHRPQEAGGRRHVYHLYVLRSRERDRVRAALHARGIETLVHYPRPVHRQPAYSELAPEGGLEVSERLCDEVLSLPLYPQLADAELEEVAAALADLAAPAT